VGGNAVVQLQDDLEIVVHFLVEDVLGNR
jgi:hypothetical protein